MEEKGKIKVLIENFPYFLNFLWDKNKIRNILKNLVEEIREDFSIFVYKKINNNYFLIEFWGKEKKDFPIEIKYKNIPFKETPFLSDDIFEEIKNSYIFPFYEPEGSAGFVGIINKDLEEINEDLLLTLYFIAFGYELLNFQEKVEDIVSRDDLTELKNSKYFLISLRRMVSFKENHPVTVIFMDLDNFKEINDLHGHFVGGRVLQKVGEFLKELFASSDYSFAIISRYGGDEFAILLPKTGLEEGVMVANMIKEDLSDYSFKISDKLEFKIMASFGVASYPVSTDKPEKLLVLADKALFEAKKRGRGNIYSIPPLEKSSS